MKIVKSIAIAILVGIGVALMGVPADAQQATAVSTPTVPNPNWCPGVPLSARPPQVQADEWTSRWQHCMNLGNVAGNFSCTNLCRGALEMQWRARMHAEGRPAEQPPKLPASTDKLQGPFPLQGGAKGWIVPLPPGLQTPAVTATPAGAGSNRDPTSTQGKLRPASFLIPSAGVTPAQGSGKPTAGFAFN
jgi:hypothetical protein